MFILDDYIENTTLQEELKNVKEQLKAVQDVNAKLKTDIDLHCKADAEKTEKIKRLSEELDALKYTNLILRANAAECKLRLVKDDNEDKIKELEAKIEMLENDRKEGLLICCDCSHGQQYRIKLLKDELSKSNAEKHELKAKIEMLSRDADKIFKEKRQEGDNLRNRIKDLEAEIDQLKSNPSTVSESELLAIHTADVETINKLNIRVHDLNATISTLIEQASKSEEENQELKKKVQELNDFIQRI